MINKLEIRTAQGALLGLPLDDVSNGFVVEEIEGLDPVKATLVSSSFANLDGQQYQSSRRDTRNIKLKLGLEPDYVTNTVRELRKRLYGFLMPKTEVVLRFYMEDGLDLEITGRVESFETALFTAEPTVDVSIICFDPDFTDPDRVTVAGSTVSTSAEQRIDYAGTVEAGVSFTLNINRALPEFTIYHRPPDGTLRVLEFQSALQAGDVLHIDTFPGAKGATVTRAGSDFSVLYGVSPQSNWLQLLPGENYIRVYATGAGIPYTIEYTNKYGGL